jgi:hypothetical protein
MRPAPGGKNGVHREAFPRCPHEGAPTAPPTLTSYLPKRLRQAFRRESAWSSRSFGFHRVGAAGRTITSRETPPSRVGFCRVDCVVRQRILRFSGLEPQPGRSQEKRPLVCAQGGVVGCVCRSAKSGSSNSPHRRRTVGRLIHATRKVTAVALDSAVPRVGDGPRYNGLGGT